MKLSLGLKGRSCEIGSEPERLDLNDWLARYWLARYELRLRAIDELRLPSYQGSTLRGAFGWAFRRVCCTRQGKCPECLLQDSCAYSLFFETPGETGGAGFADAQAPRPFVLDLPLRGEQAVAPGEELVFGLTLIGRANDFVPYFVLAFEELGKAGLGRGRGRVALERVNHLGGAAVYDGASGRITKPSVSCGTDIVEETATRLNPTGDENLTVRFLTPGRLVQGGSLDDRPSFDVLVRVLLRRLTWLGRTQCGVDLEIDYHALIDGAKRVALVGDSSRWFDWERYSSRQGNRMKLGGILGSLTYGVGWRDYLWLLALGEVVHAGKGATFGLGRYSLSLAKEGSGRRP